MSEIDNESIQPTEKKRRGRPCKYANEEERKEARRVLNRDSARRNRETQLRTLRKYYDNNREYVYARNKTYRDKKKVEIKEKLKRLEELELVISNLN